MHCSCLSAALSLLSLALLTTPSARASPPESKVASSGVADSEGDLGQFTEDPELIKRLSNFVRIGRPSSFVRIGRGSNFVRIGRPGNFVRIGRDFDQDGLSDSYPELEDDIDNDKRGSHFVRIGKASRFVRIGRGDDKPMSSFVRIGKSDSSYDNDDDLAKRSSSFVRIGKIPSSAFVRIGREPGLPLSGEQSDFGTFDRIARMGQSSFVRIGKRAAEQAAEDSHKENGSGAPAAQ